MRWLIIPDIHDKVRRVNQLIGREPHVFSLFWEITSTISTADRRVPSEGLHTPVTRQVRAVLAWGCAAQ